MQNISQRRIIVEAQLTTRAKQALKTKQRISECAMELFSKKGFDNVTVDEIVRKAGVSKGTFYVHFQAKYDIFAEKFKEIDEYYTEYLKTIPEHLTASEKIIRFYEAQMFYLRDELGFDLIRTVYSNALSQTIEQDHYLANQDRNLYQVIRNLVREGMESGEFIDDCTLDELSLHVTRCMRGTIYDWIIFGNRMDLVGEMRKFTTRFLRGIQKEH